MSLAAETTPITFDQHSSEPGKPYGIITVDCSSPHEYDDGIAVTPLDSDRESYQVSVFATDTSPLYEQDTITDKVMTATASVYHDVDTKQQTYMPMMDERLIQARHFIKGAVRDALVVSFVVGPDQPPSDIDVSFGQVEVRRNWSYSEFSTICEESKRFRRYGRAAALISGHLQPLERDDEQVPDRPGYEGLNNSWRRGATMNEAYMVAANLLVGRLLRDEDRLAIYRTHDTTNTVLAEIFDTNMAHYTVVPSPHTGLGVDVYCRVTSPLRRAEDFMMHGLLRAREEGRQLNGRDYRLVGTTVKRLNQRIAVEAFSGTTRRDTGRWIPRSRIAG